MTLPEYRETTAWQGAIALGPRLARLAEELPAAEEYGLALQLRQAMVELPAAIAQDIINDENHRQAVVLRLVATVELVERVYPALDVSAARHAVDSTAEQLLSDQWTEASALPQEEPEIMEEPEAAEAEYEAEPLPPQAPVQPQPHQPGTMPAPSPSVTSTVQSERVTINVQPDRGQ